MTAALRESAAPFMVIGGIAVILRGVARQTTDVDATVWAADIDLDDLLERCAGHGITGRIADVADFARLHQVLLLRHDETGTPMEVSLAWLPFERAALQRAEPLDVEGVTVPVAAVCDLIVYKIVAWRARDQADVERLLRTHAAALDLAALRATVAEFAELLEAPERLRAFDLLVEQVRKSE